MQSVHRIMNGLRFGGGLFLLYILAQRTIHAWNDLPALFYFTVLSNLALALFYVTGPFFQNHRLYDRFRGPITLYMAVTALIYNSILDPIFTEGLYHALETASISPVAHYVAMMASIFTHLIFPIAISIDFLFFSRQRRLSQRELWTAMAFPIAYVVFHTIHGALTDVYMYPFLDPRVLGGYHLLMLVIVMLTVAFITLYIGMHRLRNFLQNRMYDDTIKALLKDFYTPKNTPLPQ